MSDRPTMSAVVLVRNHAPHIRPCLSTLSWVDEILIVDDGSMDGSIEIAREFSTVRVVSRALQEDWSAQMNFGLEQVRGMWAFQIDVDERVPPPLAAELLSLVRRPDISGISLRILGNVCGHLMGNRPGNRRAVRLVRKGCGRFESRRVHAQLQIEGPVVPADEMLVHLGPFPTVEEYWRKNALYATLEALTNHERAGRPTHLTPVAAVTDALFKPLAVFLRKYIVEGGWREGLFGLHYACMRAIGYYMVAAATWELQREGRNDLHRYCLAHGLPYLDPNPTPSAEGRSSVTLPTPRMASNQ